jgi:hypothetical protein
MQLIVLLIFRLDFELTLDPPLDGELWFRLLVNGGIHCEEHVNPATCLQFRPLGTMVRYQWLSSAWWRIFTYSAGRFEQGAQLTVEVFHKRSWWKKPSVLSTEILFDAAICAIEAKSSKLLVIPIGWILNFPARLLRERLGVCLIIARV